MKRLFLILYVLSAIGMPSIAGLMRFTYLTNIDGWLIERKINLENDQVFCRASIPDHGSWFGTRIRLDTNDQLLIPAWIHLSEPISDNTINKVKRTLKNCRRDMFFHQ